MNRARKLAAFGAVLPLTLVLAACGGGGDDGGNTDTDGGGAATEGGGGEPAGNTLTVWAWDPAFNIYALEEAEKVYQKDHPDFELEIVETPS